MENDITPPENPLPPAIPSEKMQEAVNAIISFYGEHDNYFTRMASEKKVHEFIEAVKDSEPEAFDDILTGNINLLNIAFQKTILAATRPRGGHDAVTQAVRLSAQLSRNIDTWRRLKEFENRQTK